MEGIRDFRIAQLGSYRPNPFAYLRLLIIHTAPPKGERPKDQRVTLRRRQSSHPAPAMRSKA